MRLRYWMCALFCLILAACRTIPEYTPTPILVPTVPPPTMVPLPSIPPATAATDLPPASPVPDAGSTSLITGPVVTQVQFALALDENNQPIYPADEFVFGVTRVYVSVDYVGLGEIDQLESVWSLEGTPFIASPFEWGEGESGASQLVLYLEDPLGIRRGDWTWELKSGGEVLGAGAFRISGEPVYFNETWGLSFDPPPGWAINSETDNMASFGSPNQDFGLVLRVSPVATDGPTEAQEAAAVDLALLQQTYTEALTVGITPTQFIGLPAVLSQIRFSDGSGPKVVWVISAADQENHYSLWMLSDVAKGDLGRQILQSVALGVRLQD